MILAFEMVWAGISHAVTNSASIETIARGFPDQAVRVFAEASHLQELLADRVLGNQANIATQVVPISSRYRFRPQIVSVRRGIRELWTLLRALREAPRQEPCLIVLLSATPTAIFAASLLARLMRRRIGVQVGMHGNLNDAFGWRSRNPLIRAIDLYSALTSRHGGRVRFLVLENAIRTALAQQIPTTADTTDVLPLPINAGEAEQASPATLSAPLRIGLVGQATEAKGITPFLALAKGFRQTHPDAVRFHLVGNPGAGIDTAGFGILADPMPYDPLSRPQFIERLRRLHYVCLPLQPAYYALSASGALLDAITWLRPIIATKLPIVADLFARYGDIGFLCDDTDQMRAVIASLISRPDQHRYDRQVSNLRRIRDSRLPAALAMDYRSMIETGFPGLLTNLPHRSAADPPGG